VFDLEEYDGEDDPRQIIVRIDHSIRPSVRFEKPEDIEQVAWYYETMHHAFESFDIEAPFRKWISIDSNTAPVAFRELTTAIDKIRIDLLRERFTRNTSTTLDQTWRDKIHAYLEIIRQTVERANISAPIRDSILRKLHELSMEVDRSRAPIQKFADVLVGVCEAISAGATTLTPTVRLLERVIGALARLKSAKQKPPLARLSRMISA
jgi:hypothetical protein